MIYQTCKYFLGRLGLSLVLILGLGYAVLYFIHEIAMPGAALDDHMIQWAIGLIGLFLGFSVYGMLGGHWFRKAFDRVKNQDPQVSEERAVREFEDLLDFTFSSCFLPRQGARYRDEVIRRYAEYLLSIGSETPRAMKVYLKAFLRDPRDSKFRGPLLATFGRGGGLSPNEIDLLLVMLNADGYQDKYIANHLASVFLKKKQFNLKTESLFLKALEYDHGESESIVRFVVPLLLKKRRTDAFALKFYLRSLPFHPPEEEQFREILGLAFYEGHWQAIDPEFHEACCNVFSQLDAPVQDRLIQSVEAGRLSGKWKQFKLFTREDRKALSKLKVHLGIARSGIRVLIDGIVWMAGLMRWLAVGMLLKMFDGMIAFGKKSLRFKALSAGFVLVAVLIGANISEWKRSFPPSASTQLQPADLAKRQPPRKHTIQVAAFTSRRQADRLVRSMKRKKVNGLYVVKTKRARGGNWFKIRVGEFPGKQAAQRYANDLIDKKIVKNYFIIALPKTADSPKQP